MPKQNGVLKWGQKERVDSFKSNWYDHTVYRAPVQGTIDTGAIHSALADFYRHPLSGWSVGGYVSVGKVTDNGDGTVNVETLYHIGD